MGLSGSLMIRDIVAGERDPKALAKHRHSRVKASPEEIIKALTGNWREEHLFVLRQSLGMYDDIVRHLAECDTKLQAELANLGQKKVDLGKSPRLGSKQREHFDERQILANWAGVDLTRINGLGLTAVKKILTEVGARLGSLPHGQTLLLLARFESGDQNQWGQGVVVQNKALAQPDPPSPQDGRDELVT